MGDIYGSVQNVFEIAQLTAPSGGFFPGRLGVEVTSAMDLAPSYRISALVVVSMAFGMAQTWATRLGLQK